MGPSCLGLLLLLLLELQAHLTIGFDHVLYRGSVNVQQDGTADFSTISAAIAAAPEIISMNDRYFAIYVGAGVYEEYVVVPEMKKKLILIGADVFNTVITGNRNVADGWSTSNGPTFSVFGDGFIAVNLTFENAAGPEKHQAVAVRNKADMSVFYRCRFLGYQDTLYADHQRQFYRDCEIYGTVDFIFGKAHAVFQHCTIFLRKPLPGQYNVITANGRDNPLDDSGFTIHNCAILAAPDLASNLGTTKSYLGRPWKEYSRTVYVQSYMSDVIDVAGWIDWDGSTFALSTLFYGEYENTGPGANTAGRVKWEGYKNLTKAEALSFTLHSFIGEDWIPSGIPRIGGLIEEASVSIAPSMSTFESVLFCFLYVICTTTLFCVL